MAVCPTAAFERIVFPVLTVCSESDELRFLTEARQNLRLRSTWSKRPGKRSERLPLLFVYLSTHEIVNWMLTARESPGYMVAKEVAGGDAKHSGRP